MATQNEVVTAMAVHLYNRGWTPVPIDKAKDKAPRGQGWQTTRHASEESVVEAFKKAQNIGLLTGEASNGLVDVDLDCPEAARIASLLLPATGMHSGRADSERGHRFYLVSAPGKPEKLAYTETIIELRSDGQQTMVSPSVHPSGATVEWRDENGNVVDLPGQPSVQKWDDLVERVKMIAALVTLSKLWKKAGSRHEFAMPLAGALLRSNRAEDEVVGMFRVICDLADDQELDDRIRVVVDTKAKIDAGQQTTGLPKLKELIADTSAFSKLQSWLSLRNETPPVNASIEINEVTLADRFVADHKGQIAYTHGLGWMRYNGQKWTVDQNSSKAYSKAIQTLNCMMAEIKALPNDDSPGNPRNSLIRQMRRTFAKRTIDSMLGLAQRNADIIIDAELEGSKLLLNVQNGVLNVVTGHLQEHDPALGMVRMANVTFDPDAKCPTFDSFMDWVVDGDEDLKNDIQKAIGYSLTGETSSQTFFVIPGNGSNGKTTFIETIMNMLGDYATVVDINCLLAGDGGNSATPELAKLRGVRFVSASEFPANARFSEERIKRLSGDQMFSARMLYKDSFSFKPSFKLWVDTNHLPAAIDSSNGFWRRVVCIPFDNQISDEDRDTSLQDKLKAEASGILNWALAGVQKWVTNTKFDKMSQKAKQVKDEYRADNDYVEQFVTERCSSDPEYSERSRVLYAAYAEWAKGGGQQVMSEKSFSSRLHSLGYAKKRHERGVMFNGLQVNHTV